MNLSNEAEKNSAPSKRFKFFKKHSKRIELLDSFGINQKTI
jgi:hypothetical protein